MKDLGKILLINLGILLAYSLLILWGSKSGNSGGDQYAGMGFALGMMMVIAGHALINLIIMIVQFVKGRKELGLSYLVAVFVVIGIGFSSCMGGSSLF